MKRNNDLEKLAEEIFRSKEKYHQAMAKLPIEEKIKILIKLQEIGINANKKLENKKVWDI